MGDNRIYYESELAFQNLNSSHIQELKSRGIIKFINGKYELQENNEFKHLFSRKVPFFKKRKYFQRLDNQQLVCEDCGTDFSFHIRPVISDNGDINFKKIVCVCKDCRTKALEKQDILVPQFRRKLNYKSLNEEITKELKEQFTGEKLEEMLKDEELYRLKRKEKRTYSLTKIPLPPIPEEHNSSQLRMLLGQLEIQNIYQDLNLDEREIRVMLREYLASEANNFCPCCGNKYGTHEFTIDHIYPKDKGGRNTITNFIGMCRNCNKEKDTWTILKILQRKEFRALPKRLLLQAYKEQDKEKNRLQEVKRDIQEYIKKTYTLS